MLLSDKLPHYFSFSASDVPKLQRTFRMSFCDYEQGIHMVFDSRYMAESFAQEVLNLSKSQFSVCRVSSLNGSELGFEILIAVVPIAEISEDTP